MYPLHGRKYWGPFLLVESDDRCSQCTCCVQLAPLMSGHWCLIFGCTINFLLQRNTTEQVHWTIVGIIKIKAAVQQGQFCLPWSTASRDMSRDGWLEFLILDGSKSSQNPYKDLLYDFLWALPILCVQFYFVLRVGNLYMQDCFTCFFIVLLIVCLFSM